MTAGRMTPGQWAALSPEQQWHYQQHYGVVPPASNLPTASIAVGLLSLLISWVPVLGIIAGAGVLAMAIRGMHLAENGVRADKGLSYVGIVLGAITLAVGLIVLIYLLVFTANQP